LGFHGTDLVCFAKQVWNHPVLLADLEIFRSESNHFGPQTAPNEQCKNCPITFVSEAACRWFAKQGPGLINSQPVANPNAETLCPFDTADSGGQFRAQKASVGGFIGEPPHSGQAHVDSRGCEVLLFEKELLAKDDSAVKS
jgi:hypothetical protein